MNINRDYSFSLNITTAKLIGNNMSFRVTDTVVPNITIQLVSISKDGKELSAVGNPQDYGVCISIINPNGVILVPIQAILIDEKNSIYAFKLPREYRNVVGSYSFEFSVITEDNRIISNKKIYNVLPSVTSDEQGEIDEEEYYKIQELINELNDVQIEQHQLKVDTNNIKLQYNEHDEKMNVIDIKNNEQDVNLSYVINKNKEQDSNISSAILKNNEQDERLDYMQSMLIKNEQDIINIGSDIDGLNVEVNALETKCGEYDLILNKILSDINELKNLKNDLDVHKAEQIKDLNNIKTNNEICLNRVKGVESTNESIQTSINNINDKNRTLSSKVSVIESTNTRQDARLTSLESKDTLLQKQINTIFNELKLVEEDGVIKLMLGDIELSRITR